MDFNDNDIFEKKNGIKTIITKDLQVEFSEHITTMDISNRNIDTIGISVKFPPNLIELNLSHNQLNEVPTPVLKINNLITLDLSFNRIKYFDEKPYFCNSLKKLNISNNCLEGPPYWVWSEAPHSLVYVNLSSNKELTKSLDEDYLKELLQCTNYTVKEIIIFSCRLLKKYLEILNTFRNVKQIILGTADLERLWANRIEDVPCKVLEKFCDIEKLQLSNTQLYNINSNIQIFHRLVEIDLSQNNINTLPIEFCKLECLRICILSQNNILYLPDDMWKLINLIELYLDSNSLCMLPEQLPHLQVLDLYDNNLYEIAPDVLNIQELDLSQNYLEEPNTQEYKSNKEKLRLNKPYRYDGRKIEVPLPESEDSPIISDEDVPSSSCSDKNEEYKSTSSLEDWDDDEYWVPHYYYPRTCTTPHSPWQYFVMHKMAEGCFCPMDMHQESVADKIKYEKLCYPTRRQKEVEGQFDDYSEDDS